MEASAVTCRDSIHMAVISRLRFIWTSLLSIAVPVAMLSCRLMEALHVMEKALMTLKIKT